MCGIVGYIGKGQAKPILLQGLKHLEYRGYDSAGIAVWGKNGLQILKTHGRVAELSKQASTWAGEGNLGIGHTRWATHGKPSKKNAHPHISADGQVVLTHNGILENYAQVKQTLQLEGWNFSSDTDTEVIANWLAKLFQLHKQDPVATLTDFFGQAQGSFALAILFRAIPNRLFALRKESPLVIGIGEGENFLASDLPPLLLHTKRVYYMENGEIACLQAEKVAFYSDKGDLLSKKAEDISWQTEKMDKGKYPHFMLKEIHEQPDAVARTLRYLREGGMDCAKHWLKNVEQLTIIGCGSSYHVGIALQYAIERLCQLPVRVELASEFRYREIPMQGLVVAISQSGETADTLAALRKAKKGGCATLAIVNVVGSAIAREADCALYTQAGMEIAVATTKAYLTQLITGYYLAVQLALERVCIDVFQARCLLADLLELPEKIKEILRQKEAIHRLAKRWKDMQYCFFIGRGMDYAVSMEGSLKLKEISYIPAEAYAAGELKHGAISLIEPGTLVCCVCTQEGVFDKMRSNMQEVQSRGGELITISIPSDVACDICLPKTEEIFMASLSVIPLQLFAYFVSVERGEDVDKPRNLAKSVTVE